MPTTFSNRGEREAQYLPSKVWLSIFIYPWVRFWIWFILLRTKSQPEQVRTKSTIAVTLFSESAMLVRISVRLKVVTPGQRFETELTGNAYLLSVPWRLSMFVLSYWDLVSKSESFGSFFWVRALIKLVIYERMPVNYDSK